MKVDKSKHRVCEFIFIDITLNCRCGRYIQFSDNGQKRCKECGQLWEVSTRFRAILGEE